MPTLNGLKIKKYKLTDLVKAPYNPRKISEQQAAALRKSIDTFGLVEPIIVNEQTGNVVGGHQRIDALIASGVAETDVILVSLDEDKEKALNVALNKISGEWDDQKLRDLFNELGGGELDLTLTGFSQDEIDAMLGIKEGLTDADEVPEQVETRCKTGDIWQLGEHRLMCGDSTDAADVALLTNGVNINAVITDPPYGMNAVKNSGVLKSKYKDVIGDDTTKTAKAAFDVCKNIAEVLVFWGANYYAESLPPSGCWLVWDKNNGASDQADCELAWTNQRGVARLFTQASEKRNRVHPTQKPSSLITWIIELFEVSVVVFDPFLGSGSTLIACEQLNRKCYGMEIDEHYCDVIIERWQNFTGKTATKL